MTIWPRWMEPDRPLHPPPVIDDAGASPFPHDFLTDRLPSVELEVAPAGGRVGRDGTGPFCAYGRALVRNFPVTQDDYFSA